MADEKSDSEAPLVAQEHLKAVRVDSLEMQVLSGKLRLRPETLVKAIKEHIPTPAEQEFYINLADETESGLKPETFNKLLRQYLGQRFITEGALVVNQIGQNMEIDGVAVTWDVLSVALTLMGKFEGYEHTPLSAEDSINLSVYCGETATELVEQIDSYSWHNKKPQRHSDEGSSMRDMINFRTSMIRSIIDHCRGGGLPPTCLDEFIDEYGY